MRIEFKAYGGTGSLIGKSFVTLLALNSANLADNTNDECVVYIMDYDDVKSASGVTDGEVLSDAIANYQLLHDRGLGFLAPVKLTQDTTTLKAVRNKAYGMGETEYSLNSLFAKGANSQEIKELLTSAFTSDPTDPEKKAEFEMSNANGCYGDLAVNGFISERLLASKAFEKMGAYTNLGTNLKDAKVFYAGSTDGGTANTMIDKDIESLINYINTNTSEPTDGSRSFGIYGLRTTPYSKFKLEGDPTQVAKTRDILRNKFEMAKGVLENIENRNSASLNDPNLPSYYYLRQNGQGHPYWLDGLFISSNSHLDLTADQAHADQQYHPAHMVEFALAQQAMDVIANRVDFDLNKDHIYSYNDGADESTASPITLGSFFESQHVNYNFTYYTYEVANSGSTSVSVSLSAYIRAILLTLVTIRSDMIGDFRNYEQTGMRYIRDLFHHARGAETVTCPLVADELETFLEEAKFLVMNLVDIQEYSKFGGTRQVVNLVEPCIKFLYDSDTLGNSITPPAGAKLFVNLTANGTYEIVLGQNQIPSILAEFNSMPWAPGGGLFKLSGMHLDDYDVYVNSSAPTPKQTARNIAHNMIRRLFEVYLEKIRATGTAN